MKLKSICPQCSRELKLKSEIRAGAGYLRSYTCGHSFYETDSDESELEPEIVESLNFKSCNGSKEAFEFQKQGIQFIEKSNFNCLVADPMGLGKTIQALLAAREAKLSDGTPRFKRILILVKSACTYQWFSEAREWFSQDLWTTFMISGTKGFIPPGFRIYIMSMDTLPRFAKNGSFRQIQDLDFDLVIVDECHSFKNPDSARAQALVKFLQDISQSEIEREVTLTCNLCKTKSNEPSAVVKYGMEDFSGSWTEKVKIKINLRNSESTISYRHSSQCPKCGSRIAVYQDRIVLDERERSKGLILLSGTPIKNRADEYFVPLNLLRPQHFTSSASFKRSWLDQDPDTGKYNRIKPWRLDEFRRLTASFIIRREKSVLSLPPFRRTFENVYIEDESIATAYNRALRDLDSISRNAHKLSYWDVQENLMTLRRITGMGKIPFAVEYIDTFLDTSDPDEKIAVGIHHEGVRDGLYALLQVRGISVVKLSGEDNAEQKNRIVQQIQDPRGPRVAIINQLAGGVGLNLPAISNIINLERQWNAADEEQFEGRFWREGQTRPVLAEYFNASFKQGDRYIPTIDVYFAALVEQKRQICGESLDGWQFTADPQALRDLIEKVLSSRPTERV